MPLGIRKALREARNPAAAGGGAPRAASPDRSVVLGEVEELGIGMFWATDADGHLSFLSQRALVDLGPDSQSMIGKPLTQLFHDVDEEDGGPSQRSLAFKLNARSKLDEQIVGVPNGRGATRWWRLNGRPLTDAAGNFKGYRGSAVDISSQYAYETRVARQSQVDELTGLGNPAVRQHRLISRSELAFLNGRPVSRRRAPQLAVHHCCSNTSSGSSVTRRFMSSCCLPSPASRKSSPCTPASRWT